MADILKVTNPAKQVTDPVLLSQLSRNGIDPEYVEFTQDYAMPAIVNGKKEKGKSPYAKFYHDHKSNKKFMIVSGLPMVDGDGVTIDPSWKVAGINFFESNNLFTAKVHGNQINIVAKYDQPDGRKKGDWLEWSPQLFLNGVEQTSTLPTLLATDPVNPNIALNTIEWDYGICKRRLRIIQGRVREKWVFVSNPYGEVKIKHNHSGTMKLVLGEYATDDDTETATIGILSDAEYPFEIGASPETFYPDANAESTSVDGRATIYATGGLAWADMVGHVGNGSNDINASMESSAIRAATNTNKYDNFAHGIFLFDTSALPDVCTITGATLSIMSVSHIDQLGGSGAVALCSSAPVSNTVLANGDYDSLGAVRLANDVTLASMSADTYYNFALIDVDTNGFGYISKTSISKFGIKIARDFDNSEPTWSSGQTQRSYDYFSEQGEGYKPKLVVTYSTSTAGASVNVVQQMMSKMRS